MKKYFNKIFLIAIFINTAAFTILPLPACAVDFYQSSMVGESDDHYRIAGLTFQVQDEQGPSLIMAGGAMLGFWDRYLIPFPFMFGRIQTGVAGSFVSQTVNSVANKMLFGGDLSVTVSRLSPALLLETSSSRLNLFAPDIASASANLYTVQDHLASPPEYLGTVNQHVITPGFAILGGTIKPLRWAVPRADGSIATGVLGSQTQVAIPVRGVPRATSEADAPSLPPLDQLGSKWLILWYGADSVFVRANNSLARLDNNYHADPWGFPKPWWGVPQEAYQADIPMLIVFNQNPSGLAADTTGISFSFSAGIKKAAVMPLFGAKILKASDTEQWLNGLPQEVINQANNWADRLGQYPDNVTETVSYDSANDRVSFIENVSFSEIRPGSFPEAPLPAMLALAYGQGLLALSFSSTPLDATLSTEFGPIMSIPGTGYSWSISGLAKYIGQSFTLGPSNAESAPLEQELIQEVDKILQAGHLRPYLYNMRYGGSTYFRDPSEILYFLSDTLPLLPLAKQQEVISYLTSERTSFRPETVGFLPYNRTVPGASRVLWDETPFISRQGYYTYDQAIPRSTGGQLEINEFWENPIQSLYRAYGLSRYYQVSGRDPQADSMLTYCQNKLNDILSAEEWDTLGWYWGKYIYRRWNHYNEDSPRSVHRNLAGVIGALNIYKQIGQDAPVNFWKVYAKLSTLRFSMARYGKYLAAAGIVGPAANPSVAQTMQQWGDMTNPENYLLQARQISQYGVGLGTGASFVSGFGGQHETFKEMAPETGRLLRDWGLGPDIKRFLDFYTKRQSNWFRYWAPMAEGLEWRFSYPSDSHQLFMAHAWIAGTPASQLEKYIDLPWMYRGDFYYLQKLAETIKVYRGITWEGEVPVLPRGDINNDTQVDVLDIQACVNHILGIQDLGSRADVNQDGSVDVLDVQAIVNIILGA